MMSPVAVVSKLISFTALVVPQRCSGLLEHELASDQVSDLPDKGNKVFLASDTAGVGPILCCKSCKAHLASSHAVVSKCFQGRGGRALLLESCVNVTRGPPEERFLMTGKHRVCDVSCSTCSSLLGWEYVSAEGLIQTLP
ncbi:unnamed protein product [Chrysoparadoxa australica]